MRRYLLVFLLMLVACSCWADDRRLRVLFRDYKLMDEDVRPLSAGLMLWENKELPNHVGPYASVGLFSYNNWRFEVGGLAVWNEKVEREYAVEISMLTGISHRFENNIVVGVWYAPFWNTYGRNPDDPWGIMIGYAIPTP